MTTIVVLPHETLCPNGVEYDSAPGVSICDSLLAKGIDIEHACEKSCACTTSHVVVRQGFTSLEASEEKEDDLLDRAWGLEPNSRLSCQAKVGNEKLVIQIPKYTINHASEGKH